MSRLFLLRQGRDAEAGREGRGIIPRPVQRILALQEPCHHNGNRGTQEPAFEPGFFHGRHAPVSGNPVRPAM